jgi:hypothetical protein
VIAKKTRRLLAVEKCAEPIAVAGERAQEELVGTQTQFDEPVLVVRLRGGLGNQLFEYAAAYSIALRNQVRFQVDAASGFRGDRFGRRFELGSFSLTAPILEKGATLELSKTNKVLREYYRVREYIGMRYLGKNYDESIHRLRVRSPFVFDSYCQSYLYFCDVEQDIRNEFSFREVPIGLDRELVLNMQRSNSVCLHLRRQFGLLGDGTSSAAVTSYYGACDIGYYKESISRLRSDHGRLSIYIFSDDISWVQENLRTFAYDDCETQIVDETDTIRSFYMMRSCRHFIIANSTFSWWAAWLGHHPAKSVLAPSIWTSGQKKYPKGFIPDKWKII